jgi:hypothetical protein
MSAASSVSVKLKAPGAGDTKVRVSPNHLLLPQSRLWKSRQQHFPICCLAQSARLVCKAVSSLHTQTHMYRYAGSCLPSQLPLRPCPLVSCGDGTPSVPEHQIDTPDRLDSQPRGGFLAEGPLHTCICLAPFPAATVGIGRCSLRRRTRCVRQLHNPHALSLYGGYTVILPGELFQQRSRRLCWVGTHAGSCPSCPSVSP